MHDYMGGKKKMDEDEYMGGMQSPRSKALGELVEMMEGEDIKEKQEKMMPQKAAVVAIKESEDEGEFSREQLEEIKAKLSKIMG